MPVRPREKEGRARNFAPRYHLSGSPHKKILNVIAIHIFLAGKGEAKTVIGLETPDREKNGSRKPVMNFNSAQKGRTIKIPNTPLLKAIEIQITDRLQRLPKNRIGGVRGMEFIQDGPVLAREEKDLTQGMVAPDMKRDSDKDIRPAVAVEISRPGKGFPKSIESLRSRKNSQKGPIQAPQKMNLTWAGRIPAEEKGTDGNVRKAVAIQVPDFGYGRAKEFTLFHTIDLPQKGAVSSGKQKSRPPLVYERLGRIGGTERGADKEIGNAVAVDIAGIGHASSESCGRIPER